MRRILGEARDSSVLRLAVSVLGVAVVASLLFGWLPKAWNRTDLDRDVYQNYYQGARAVLEGRALYRPYPEYGPYLNASPEHRLPLQQCVSNLPPIYVLAAPLATLPFLTFARVWCLLVLLGLFVYAACLAHLATGRVSWPSFSVAIVLLGGLPGTLPALGMANIGPVLWALFGLALVSLRLRGGMFAAVALVKVHTMWPLAVASWHDRARVYVPAAIVLLVGLLAGALAPGGFGAWLDWVRYAAPNAPAQGTFNHANISISFAGLRLARMLGWHYTTGPLPLAARLYLSAMGIGAPLVTIRLVRRLEHALQYACITTAAVLFAPLCWLSYLAYGLAAVALTYRSVWVRGGHGAGRAAVGAGGGADRPPATDPRAPREERHAAP